MKIVVKCEPGDAGELLDWLENQDIVTVETSNNYNTQEEEDAGYTTFTIQPHFAPETPLEAASFGQVWSRFTLQLLAQELCY